jgi:hypothetical protein
MVIRGIDFSGAAEPGDAIWLAEGRFDGRTLEITACRSAAEAFGKTRRAPALAALAGDLLHQSV